MINSCVVEGCRENSKEEIDPRTLFQKMICKFIGLPYPKLYKFSYEVLVKNYESININDLYEDMFRRHFLVIGKNGCKILLNGLDASAVTCGLQETTIYLIGSAYQE